MFHYLNRQLTMRWRIFLAVVMLAGGVAGWANLQQSTVQAEEKKTDYALKQARREMAMLDDIYKTAIVLITTHYVDGRESTPAGSAFKALFDSMKEKKWHEVRLIDGTGDPYEPDNTPHEGFEAQAMKELLAGKATVESVVEEDGKRYLLGATAIPVVMDKCVLCHEVYRDVPNGQAIGALSYRIPIQDE